MTFFKRIQFKFVQKTLELNERLIFEKRVNRVLKSILPQKVEVVFDIGANKGQSIRLFQKWFPGAMIYSFEPNPYLFKELRKNNRGNDKIKLHELALSNINGTRQFNENIFDSSSTLETINPKSKYLRKKSKILGVSPTDLIISSYPVKVRMLSHLIKELNLKRVDFIKIDVEGHELNCLQGLFYGLNAKIKCIQIELQSNDLYVNNDNSNKIFELLKKNGFDKYKKVKHGFGSFSDIIFWKSKPT